MNDRRDSQLDDIKGEISSLVSKLKRFGTGVAEDAAGNGSLQDAKDAASRAVDDVKAKAGEVKVKAQDAAAEADAFAKEKPWIVAAAAAGLGLVLGAIMTGRKSRD